MKATNCGKWCHMICARWCPDPIGLNGGLLEGLTEVRTSFKCIIQTHWVNTCRALPSTASKLMSGAA